VGDSMTYRAKSAEFLDWPAAVPIRSWPPPTGNSRSDTDGWRIGQKTLSVEGDQHRGGILISFPERSGQSFDAVSLPRVRTQ
jgi:hypothetical protein